MLKVAAERIAEHAAKPANDGAVAQDLRAPAAAGRVVDVQVQVGLVFENSRDPGFPIVLHGSSSVPQEYVDMINENGGKLPDAVGIPEEQLRKASKSAVCKINIDSDSRLAFTAAVRKVFADKPGEFDPRKFCGPARDEMEKMYKHKILDVLASNNKLAK